MTDILDYKTALRTLAVSIFFTMLLSAAMLEVYLLICPVRASRADFPALRKYYLTNPFLRSLNGCIDICPMDGGKLRSKR